MHLFISAGEPSGDLHGANLINALKRIDPSIQCSGFGGDRMEAAGSKLLYPLTKLAVMWFLHAILNIFTFLRLVKKADRFFHEQKPDAVIIIDFPGFHFNIAKRAHAQGIPVYWFVPPQLWAWAGWRVKKMKKWVDHVLSALPFEDDWFRQHGMSSSYIGHPYFDEMATQKLDPLFMAEQRRHIGPAIAILPGSRMQEVTRNLREMLEAAAIVHTKHPETRFLIASFNEAQAEVARQSIAGLKFPVEVHVGRTPEIIELADACISVSGSVSLEMMVRETPAVIVYRMGRVMIRIARLLKKCKYITLVNLLADRELFPEFATDKNPCQQVAQQVTDWLDDPAKAEAVREALREVKARVAQPGASERAANFVLAELGRKTVAKSEAA